MREGYALVNIKLKQPNLSGNTCTFKVAFIFFYEIVRTRNCNTAQSHTFKILKTTRSKKPENETH